jgi:hypothetical protein
MAYLGVPPQSGFITTAKQRVTSSTNAYVDLDHSISSIADVIVFVNFVKQDTTNLTLTTSTRITLGDTLVSSDVVEIHYLGKAVNTQTPSAGTVTSDMLAGSIANSKLANSSITLNGSAVSLGGSATVGGNNTPAFFVKNTSNQDVSHGSENQVAFDTEILDTDNAFASNKFTPQTAGKYFITAQFAGSDDTTTSGNLAYVVLKIRKNGSGYQSRGVINFSNNPGRQGSVSVQAIVDLNGSSDFVDISAEVGINDSTTGRIVSEYARASGFKLIGA